MSNESQNSPTMTIDPPRGAAGDDRHLRSKRFRLRVPAMIWPVDGEGQLLSQTPARGETINLSTSGIAFEVTDTHIPNGPVVLGLGLDDRILYAGVTVRSRRPLKLSRVRLGAKFGGPAEQMLNPEQLLPYFDRDAVRFRSTVADDVLAGYVRAGILKPIVVDRVEVCPQCGALPSFRQGCPECGSARLSAEPLIHHFACAFVGHIDDFQSPTGLVCPKCRLRDLVVGADYEHLTGPCHCNDCAWSGTTVERIGHCLGCDHRFPGFESRQQDLTAYDVHRFDPLAFVEQRA